MQREIWIEKIRQHLSMASVGNSTLMMQSGKDRVTRARTFLCKKMQLDGISKLNETEFIKFLDEKTICLANKLPRPEDKTPNWGAARKVLNIYLRLCVMNKDLNPTFDLKQIESFLEVPLDSEVIKGIDKHASTNHSKKFRIKNLTEPQNSEIQALAKRIAADQDLHRYELDVLYWNHQTNELT